MKNRILVVLVAVSLIVNFGCKEPAGEKAVVSEAGVVAKAEGVSLPVAITSSVILWEGAKPTATHTGTIKLSSGEIFVKKGNITGGSFVIDMNSISNTDLDGGMKVNLENHLKGFAEGKENDFFNVAQFPTGSFDITKVVRLSGDEKATHLIYGNLTLKGIANEVQFKALIGIGQERVEVSTSPFTIDRTKWGINFGSKTIFDNLGDKFVHDEIGLTIQLKAGKELI